MCVTCVYILVTHAAWSVHVRLDLALHCLLAVSALLAHVHLWTFDSVSEPALTVKTCPNLSPKANVTMLDKTTVFCCATFTNSSQDCSDRFTATPLKEVVE